MARSQHVETGRGSDPSVSQIPDSPPNPLGSRCPLCQLCSLLWGSSVGLSLPLANRKLRVGVVQTHMAYDSKRRARPKPGAHNLI